MMWGIFYLEQLVLAVYVEIDHDCKLQRESVLPACYIFMRFIRHEGMNAWAKAGRARDHLVLTNYCYHWLARHSVR